MIILIAFEKKHLYLYLPSYVVTCIKYYLRFMGGGSNKYFRIIFCSFDLSWATMVSIFFMFNNHNKGVGNTYLITMQLKGSYEDPSWKQSHY